MTYLMADSIILLKKRKEVAIFLLDKMPSLKPLSSPNGETLHCNTSS